MWILLGRKSGPNFSMKSVANEQM